MNDTAPLIVVLAAGLEIDTTGEGGGAGFGATTAVAADVAHADPYLFVALTATLTVLPTSAVASVYVGSPLPDEKGEHEPSVEQKLHW